MNGKRRAKGQLPGDKGKGLRGKGLENIGNILVINRHFNFRVIIIINL